jgi:ATP phosphoribosyltransferase regulatory subunit
VITLRILDKKLSEAVRTIRECFYSSGFYEVFPQSFIKSKEVDGLRFIYRNDIYVLEPDITLRLMDRQIQQDSSIFYISQQTDRNLIESLKAGGEIIGGDPMAGSIKILKTAIKILDDLGLPDFKIDIGLSGIFNRYSGSKHWPEIKKAIKSRDYSALDNMENKEKGEIIKTMDTRTKSSGIKILDSLIEELDDPRIIIDLGTVRQPDYYNGPIFEIYGDSGFIGGGGNYRIQNTDACGFALDITALYRMYIKNMEVEK